MATATTRTTETIDRGDRVFRISLDLYRRMGELAMIGTTDRVELLDGLLIRKMTKGPRHVTSTHRAFKIFLALLPDGWHPRVESPVELPAGPEGQSAPEPDIAVVRGLDSDFNHRHPGPGEVALIIQVADSSLAIDRKGLRRYAWAGIPCVWIINLRDETIEIHTGPSGPAEDAGYASKITRRPGEMLDFWIDGGNIGGLPVINLLA